MSLEIIEEYRSISVPTLETCGVHWVDDDDYAVRFPYRHWYGEWYERKGLDPRLDPKGRPKILSPNNAPAHMYNPLRLGPNADFVMICEGEYDTLSAIDTGYPAVGAQGTGAFAATWTRLFGGAVVVIAFDSDEAGILAAQGIRKWFRKHGDDAYILETPEGTDLNDLHKEGILEEYIDEFIEDNGLAPE